MKRNPEALRDVDISIHPFQKLMLRANKYYQKSLEAKNTNPELAKTYEEKYLEARNAYIDRMAHVLKTFLLNFHVRSFLSPFCFTKKIINLFQKTRSQILDFD